MQGCQSQNFLFQKGIEHIIACVAPMHAIELKQCIIRFEALCFLNVQKCLIYINDGTMIALCQLFDDFPIFFNAVGCGEGVEIRIHHGRRRNQNGQTDTAMESRISVLFCQKAFQNEHHIVFIFPRCTILPFVEGTVIGTQQNYSKMRL